MIKIEREDLYTSINNIAILWETVIAAVEDEEIAYIYL